MSAETRQRLAAKMRKKFGLKTLLGNVRDENNEENANNNNKQHTLDRMVNAKHEAHRRWKSEQEAFDARRLAHESHMLNMEEAEALRRQRETDARVLFLQETKRKHNLIETAITEQIEILHKKLEEHRLKHREEEENIEQSIQEMSKTLEEVRESIETRKKAVKELEPAKDENDDDFKKENHDKSVEKTIASAPPLSDDAKMELYPPLSSPNSSVRSVSTARIDDMEGKKPNRRSLGSLSSSTSASPLSLGSKASSSTTMQV